MTRVLLVEDCSDILFILQFELESIGYTVDAASDATAALDLAKKNRPDVIVSDINMPGIDGCEFMRRIRQMADLAKVPAIALTGFSLQTEVQQALMSGFTTHLTKPVEAAQVAKSIEQLTALRLHRKAS